MKTGYSQYPKKLNFFELVSVIGEVKAVYLCKLYSGRLLPSALQILREKRDRALIKDYFAGAQIGELCAKYDLPQQHVRSRITKEIKEAIRHGVNPQDL